MVTAIPHIFDRSLYLARQAKASAAQAALLAHVAGDLADRLAIINHHFTDALLIAGNPASIQTVLEASGKISNLTVLAPPRSDALGLAPHSCDALFSMLDLHCVNDVPGYLAQCAAALRPDGLFMACFFAGDTLAELRESWLAAEAEFGGASPRVAPMIGLREMGGLLQRAGLALPVADSDRLTLRYQNLLSLLRELKAFGFSNPLTERRKTFTTARMIANLSQHYEASMAAADGRVRATVEIFWALAWKPHPSQPQPKKPGSATIRLEDALRGRSHES